MSERMFRFFILFHLVETVVTSGRKKCFIRMKHLLALGIEQNSKSTSSLFLALHMQLCVM